MQAAELWGAGSSPGEGDSTRGCKFTKEGLSPMQQGKVRLQTAPVLWTLCLARCGQWKAGFRRHPCCDPQPSSSPPQHRGPQHPSDPPCTQHTAQRVRARRLPSANPGHSALSLGIKAVTWWNKLNFPWGDPEPLGPAAREEPSLVRTGADTCTCTRVESLRVAGTRRAFACIIIQSELVIIAWANPECRRALSWA